MILKIKEFVAMPPDASRRSGSNRLPQGSYRIDLHSHFLPPNYRTALAKHVPYVPPWSAESHIAFMDTWHIQKSVVSMSQPFDFGDLAETRAVTRDVNIAGQALLEQHSDRFGVHVALPLPDVAASIAELDYAFDELGLNGGVMLNANYGGIYLGDPKYDDLFSELDRRGCVVWVHPSPQFNSPEAPFGDHVLEFPFETTRAAANIIYQGLPQRFPKIKWQLSHGGGTLPFTLFRLASLQILPFAGLPQTPTDGPFTPARQFYYDTAIVGSSVQLLAMEGLTGPSKIVFGTDWPYTELSFAPNIAQKAPWFKDALPQDGDPNPVLSEVFEAKERQLIERTNARKLHPDLVSARW